MPATINKIMPETIILICDNHIGVISELILNNSLANKPETPHITHAKAAKNAHNLRCFCVIILIPLF